MKENDRSIKRFDEIDESDVFFFEGGKGDIRTGFWRVGEKTTGVAFRVQPPSMTDVENENGMKSGTFFGLNEEVEIIFTLPEK